MYARARWRGTPHGREVMGTGSREDSGHAVGVAMNLGRYLILALKEIMMHSLLLE
jgi:hypothetical protein